MMKIAGHCSKCGAPYYQESVWFSTTPPPTIPTCNCWNIRAVITTKTSDVNDFEVYINDN